MDEELVKSLRRECGANMRIKLGVPAREITTFKLGGELACLIQPSSISDLVQIVQLTQESRGFSGTASWRVLGCGSNVLVSDRGCSDLVISLGHEFSEWRFISEPVDLCNVADLLRSRTAEDDDERSVGGLKEGESQRVFALAGLPLMGLSRVCSQLGLAGLEFAAGIPASVGGAVKMNAGAHGACMAQVLRRIVILNHEGNLSVLDAKDLCFSYRSSALALGDIVIGAELELVRENPKEVTERRERALSYRKRTQPLQYPSAGSIFRNPVLNSFESSADNSSGESRDAIRSAGELLEKVGMKGRRVGGVEFSNLHANWIIKVGEPAHAVDVLQLIDEGQRRVFEDSGVMLTPELCVW